MVLLMGFFYSVFRILVCATSLFRSSTDRLVCMFSVWSVGSLIVGAGTDRAVVCELDYVRFEAAFDAISYSNVSRFQGDHSTVIRFCLCVLFYNCC